MDANFHPTPFPWSEFPMECLWYFPIMGPVHFIFFGFYYWATFFWRKSKTGEFRRLVFFWFILFLVSSIFNGLWSCSVWDRLYDSMDYVSDFSPFWPITQGVIDAPWGNDRRRLLGISLWQLQLVWLVFALGTWITTILLYRAIRRQRPLNLKESFHPSAQSECGS
jgi:hypothetical protein